MGRASTITALPADVRRFLERALTEQGFAGYDALETLMREKGYAISRSAIHRYGKKIESRFAAIKASTEAARIITEGASDDQDARSEAVIALCQTEIFEAMVALQETHGDALTPVDRMNAMSKVAKNIATLTRASISQKQYKVDVEERIRRQLIDEQKAKLDALGSKGGVSEETKLAIRQVLGIG